MIIIIIGILIVQILMYFSHILLITIIIELIGLLSYKYFHHASTHYGSVMCGYVYDWVLEIVCVCVCVCV